MELIASFFIVISFEFGIIAISADSKVAQFKDNANQQVYCW
jgi:hypothetical protein